MDEEILFVVGCRRE